MSRPRGSATPAPAAATGTITLGDLTVNRMGFGAMRLTGEGSGESRADRAEAMRVLRRAVELGVDFIDTADSYGPDVSEEIIAEALHPYPDGLVIATKGGLPAPGPGQLGDQRPARAPPPAARGQPPPPAARPDRPLPAPPYRPQGTRRASSSTRSGSSSARAWCATSAFPRSASRTSTPPVASSPSCPSRTSTTLATGSGTPWWTTASGRAWPSFPGSRSRRAISRRAGRSSGWPGVTA